MSIPSRADWLRTEAAVVCDELTKDIFPVAAKKAEITNLPDLPIWQEFPKDGAERAIAQSSAALEILAQSAMGSLVKPNLSEDVLARFRTYTRLRDLKATIEERLLFQCRFPLALLNCIRVQDEEFSEKIIGVESVAGIFSQPWFHEMITVSSNTTDDFWGTLGINALDNDEITTPPPLRRGVDIRFQPSGIVTFSDTTLERLTHQKTLQNTAAKDNRPTPGNYSLYGTTDGCPLRPSHSDLPGKDLNQTPPTVSVKSDEKEAGVHLN